MTESTTDAGNATPAHTPPTNDVTAPTPLSTERRCRRADGIREQGRGRRFHHSDYFDHYGLRWSVTFYSTYLFSFSLYLCSSCIRFYVYTINLKHVFLFCVPDLVNLTRLSPKKSNNGIGARLEKKPDRGKK